jgi:hypothetical protein
VRVSDIRRAAQEAGALHALPDVETVAQQMASAAALSKERLANALLDELNRPVRELLERQERETREWMAEAMFPYRGEFNP